MYMNRQEKCRGIAREFRDKVLEKYGERVDTIILFGSAARGVVREDSDN